MAKFDASFQLRVGLRGKPETPEFSGPEETPTVDELTTEVKAAIEARWPDFIATVGGERLDK